jgi:hypothetical protein
MKMPNWPALLLAPSLALTNLSITYALVTPSCALQDRMVMNGVSALALLVCALFTWAAWRNWRNGRIQPDVLAEADDAATRPPFVAMVSCAVGAISCLTVLAQWFPQWILSPCGG